MQPAWMFLAVAIGPTVTAGDAGPQLKFLGTLEGGRPCLLANIAFSPDGKREKATRTDQEAIRGTWKVVNAVSAGEKPPNLDKANVQFIFAGDKLETKALDKVESRGIFKLDPAKKPKTIDWLIAGEEGTLLGIYRLEGDRLKLCLPNRGRKERPSDFASTKDNKCSVFVLERKK